MFLILSLLSLLASVVLAGTALRLRAILDRKRLKPIRHGRRNSHQPTHLLIVLGSGGHTAEMIAMLERAVAPSSTARAPLAWKDFAHRTWVVSEGDSLSATRAKTFEELAAQTNTQSISSSAESVADPWGPGTYNVVIVPRARKIHQPLLSAPLSSLACLQACWKALTAHTARPRLNPNQNQNYNSANSENSNVRGHKDFPDVILCNGPATATILVLTSVILRFFDIGGCNSRNKMRTVYIESWARVQKLSLSGRLLTFVVDRFVVQWPQLAKKVGGRAEYMGFLV